MASSGRDNEPTSGNSSGRMVKHQWTPQEDDKLVESLYELYTMGTWKCDTGFKSGYLVQLEKMMDAKMPSAGVKACPHIESRVKTLKKQCLAIAEMFVNGSGFSWNEDAKMVVVEKSVFDLWVKSHPTAKGLRNKPFPHYDTLLEIFGKDRANGLGATTLAQEEETIEATAANEGGQSTQYDDGLDGIEVSSTQPQASPTGCAQQKARKSSDGWTRGIFEVSSSIKNLVDGTMVYLDKIGNAMSEDNTMKKEVAAELQKIDGLTLIDIMNAGKDIISDSYLSTMFLSLPEEKRREMVLEVLKKHTQS